MSELLLELHSEEIPARMQARAAEDLRALLTAELDVAAFSCRRVETFAAPQRLAAFAEGIPAGQPDVEVERRGPRTDAPQKAIDGFLGSLGDVEVTLTEQAEKKGTFLVARFVRPGRPAAELIGPMIEGTLARFPWPKSMRWGDHAVRWIRPLRHILCILDGEVVPVRFGPVASGRYTYGHRFMAPGPIEVHDFGGYRRALAEAKVVLDADERGRTIVAGAARYAETAGLTLDDDPALVDEIAGLVEWPVPLMGTIDERFMELPPEVLVTSMRTHQKYLALRRPDGALANRFVAVANVEVVEAISGASTGGGAAIVAGNERVLRARLWDAEFFWRQDRKVPLESRLEKLDSVVYHARLGSLGEKTHRLRALAAWLCGHVDGVSLDRAVRAAALCKADLVTGMVGEFPELQGVMGGYYARHDGEAEAVSEAIAAHYRPQGPNDGVPTASESMALALADKLDTLTGFFGIGERPTGSKDPFALRRAALGVIRIVLENRLRLPLRAAVAEAAKGYGRLFDPEVAERLPDDLLGFFADRLQVALRGQGVRHDVVAAAFAAGRDDDLVRLEARIAALRAFLASEDGANLLTAFRRASNIVQIEEKKDGRRYDGEPFEALLVEPEERRLWAELVATGRTNDERIDREDYAGAMTALSGLRRPVDAFFDRVRVNVDDPELRTNRLNLLYRIRTTLGSLADLDRIEGVEPGLDSVGNGSGRDEAEIGETSS